MAEYMVTIVDTMMTKVRWNVTYVEYKTSSLPSNAPPHDFMLFSASQEKDGVVVNVNKSTGKDTL
jgi:hypothetical protein